MNEPQQKEVMCRLTYTWSESDVEGVHARQSKVCNLDFSAVADQDVFWFQVAVHHHVCVQEVKSSQQLLHHILHREKSVTAAVSRAVSTDSDLPLFEVLSFFVLALKRIIAHRLWFGGAFRGLSSSVR